MPKETAHVSPFKQIKHSDESGEFWSARELAALLDYAEWRNFDKVVQKAIKACENSGQQPSDHFVEATEMITLGSRAERRLLSYAATVYYVEQKFRRGDYVCHSQPPLSV